MASIRGGVSMVNDVLAVVAFIGFLLGKVLNSSIPLRLLGV
ncbi:hypothetical protein CNEO2_110090 [Clostridium neonatale]|uniref:Uncharacterized protein n=1 Tax=Clostridium neonatale TaxID=137838 RepID=A0AAD1YCU9_9CLOT|nr:hypothetical protein CNEO2_70092 [Clostridium neonatale]CAI3216032.1 hypothetical protein CNEO2_890011 [Clostridium neonatale]CAI3216450.1 hypothetical protein CNEO2_90091 [Clostridium neonatale]CAI3246285.1 hypothetical protein CNEO2_60089 [Clostridium neonatale]CAI3248033.1 hypothetical protein CNEO2_790011 [Clostridium neonatale]